MGRGTNLPKSAIGGDEARRRAANLRRSAAATPCVERRRMMLWLADELSATAVAAEAPAPVGREDAEPRASATT